VGCIVTHWLDRFAILYCFIGGVLQRLKLQLAQP